MQYSHHNIAIFTSCPKSPKWCQMVTKGLQNESLGTPKCSKVEPSGPQRVPRGAQSAPKCAKRSPWETAWNASWAQSGPSALQGSTFEWISDDVGCILLQLWSECAYLLLGFGEALVAKAKQPPLRFRISNPIGRTGRKAITTSLPFSPDLPHGVQAGPRVPPGGI